MLSKKMFRDILDHKTLFLSIFLMAFIGVAMFSGINGEADGLETSIDRYYEETNLADGWIYSVYLNDLFLEQVDLLGATKEMEREVVVDSEAMLQGNPTITLHFVENNTISKFYLIEGEQLDINDAEGVWLDKSFADARNLKVGDSISFKSEGYEIKKQIRGLGYSPEYVYNAPYYTVKQDYSKFGFAYFSHKAFPLDNVPYNVLKVKFSGTPETYRNLLDYRFDGYYSLFLPRSNQLSVSECESEVSQHKMMADIFPFIFIFVSMLMLLTSMKRIITHQRTQIGILKANGFENYTLIKHYLSYGFVIILLGSLLGLILGPIILSSFSYPLLFYKFRLPYLNYVGGINYAYVVVLMIILSSIVSYLSIRTIINEAPSVMIRPKALKVPTSSIVERIPLWKRLPFNFRWNYRDAKRNKFRQVMALLGVMGCTILLISAFGLNDGTIDSKDWEFNDIVHYESKLAIDKNASNVQVDDIASKVDGDKIMEEGIEIDSGPSFKSAVLLVLNNTDLITPTTKDRIALEINDEVSMSQRMADLLNLSAGDTIKWHIKGSDKWVETKIDKIHADPVSQGLIVSADKLNELGLNYAPTSIVTSQHVDENYSGIRSIDYRVDLYGAWDSVNRAVTFLISILLSFAIVLAVVVLYNLNVLTYTEIERDVATLKVLGFKSITLIKLLFTQSFVILITGFILGVPIGYYVLVALWNSVGEKRYVVASISQTNLLLTFGLIFGVSVIINLLFYYKIKKLDMVDALKIFE